MAGTSTAQEIFIPLQRPDHEGLGASLRRRWRWVAMVGLVGLIVGASMATRTDLRYSARTRLRLLGERSAPSDIRGSGDDIGTLRAQYYVLRSPRIFRETADRLDLPIHWNVSLEEAAQRLAGMVQAKKLLDVNITELKVTSEHPQMSADIANTVAEVYIHQANQPRLDQARQTLARLREECDQQTALLREAEAQTLQLKQGIGLNVGDTSFTMASLNGHRQSLVQAEAALIEARIRSESISRAGDDVLLALQRRPTDDRVSHDLSTRLMMLESKLGELERRYGPEHPQVQKAGIEYQEAMRTASSHVSRITDMAQSEQKAAETRARTARQGLAEAAGTLVAAGGAYGQLLAAQHKEETLRNLTRMLNDRAQKLDVELNLTGPAADVLELASATSIPDMGTPLQVAMAAVGIGLLVGLGVAVLVDRFDGRLRGAEEVEWQLNVPMLGALGPIKSMLDPARAGTSVETIRMIRNGIDFADHTLRTLCITSASPREGTSTTVANLAWAWAEHGAKVLVIDANLRRPSMHRLLGMKNEAGVSEVIGDRSLLEGLILPTPVANISLLSAGKAAGGKSVVSLTPQALSEILLWARSHADIILIDTAPVLKTSDTSIIARQTDGTILVARQKWTSTRDLRRAVHLLDGGGEGLLGVVLTGSASGASWDPLPMNEPTEQASELETRRVAASRQRKRTRYAA